VGFGDRSTGMGTFGGKFGQRQCNQWGLYGVSVQQRQNTALYPNYFGHTCYYYYYEDYRCTDKALADYRSAYNRRLTIG